MMEITDFLARFHDVKETHHKNNYLACCPCHNDEATSLYISYDADNKKIVLHDFGECYIQDILEKAGLRWHDIFSDDKDWSQLKHPEKNMHEIIAIYDYGKNQRKVRWKDKTGEKDFRFQVKNKETGNWEWGQKKSAGVWKETLYFKGSPDNNCVFFLEGEKDANTVYRLLPDDFTCVSTPYGAVEKIKGQKWNKVYAEQLRGKNVYILSDYDNVGYKHLRNVAEALYGVANKVYALDIVDIFPTAKDKDDITDCMMTWGENVTAQKLQEAIEKAKPFDPVTSTIGIVDGIKLSNGKFLDFGDYEITPSGTIASTTDDKGCTVCPHIIYLTAIYRDIKTGTEQYNLHYEIGKSEVITGNITVDPETIFDTRKITSLSEYGISVSSGESAKRLQTYLRNQLDLNRDILPVQIAASTMGWYNHHKDFIPYTKNVIYNGDSRFKSLFGAIQTEGNFETWRKEMLACCAVSKEVKIFLAASFASPIAELCGCLPAIINMWSQASSIGKTVSLYAAASVWGYPVRYTKSFKTTSTGLEVLCSELNHLPLCIDESMLASDGKGGFKVNIYDLAEGVGKVRSNKGLGLNDEPRWCNLILTTGEAPLTSASDGAGAYNRIIDIICHKKLYKNAKNTADIVKAHYGHAGKKFIESLMENDNEILENIKFKHNDIYQDFLDKDVTEKQAATGALLVLASQIACEKVLETDNVLTVDELLPFLKTEGDVDMGTRAYQVLCDWIESCRGNFVDECKNTDFTPAILYGRICKPDADTEPGTRIVKIIKMRFVEMCNQYGFNEKAFIEWLKNNNLLQRGTDGRSTRTAKFDGKRTDTLFVKIPWVYESEQPTSFEPYMNEKEPDDDIRDEDDYEEENKTSFIDITPKDDNYSDFVFLDDNGNMINEAGQDDINEKFRPTN